LPFPLALRAPPIPTGQGFLLAAGEFTGLKMKMQNDIVKLIREIFCLETWDLTSKIYRFDGLAEHKNGWFL